MLHQPGPSVAYKRQETNFEELLHQGFKEYYVLVFSVIHIFINLHFFNP